MEQSQQTQPQLQSSAEPNPYADMTISDLMALVRSDMGDGHIARAAAKELRGRGVSIVGMIPRRTDSGSNRGIVAPYEDMGR